MPPTPCWSTALSTKAATGTPDATYTVLVNSFIYEGGDGYRIGDYDPDGHDTSVLYRQPTLDWIEAQGSSMVNPIDDEIDALIGGE